MSAWRSRMRFHVPGWVVASCAARRFQLAERRKLGVKILPEPPAGVCGPDVTVPSVHRSRTRWPLSTRPEDLTPAEEGSLDPDVLEAVELAGQRVLRQHR